MRRRVVALTVQELRKIDDELQPGFARMSGKNRRRVQQPILHRISKVGPPNPAHGVPNGWKIEEIALDDFSAERSDVV